jgi:stage II sporulation protein D
LKKLYFHLVSLAVACALFGASTVYAASNIDCMALGGDAFSEMDEQDFLQNQEPGIADSVSDFAALLDSMGMSSNSVSSENHVSSAEGSSESSSAHGNSSTVSSGQESSQSSSVPASSTASSTPSSAPSSEAESSSETSSSEPSSEENPSTGDEELDELIRIVAGAVQREIVGVNTVPRAQYYEAYKAQAVASHTYMEYYKKSTGSYPVMSYTEPHAKTLELVSEVIRELIYYNGSVINAVYHAASGGHTQSASYVWGGSVPYLIGVESAYDTYDSTTSLPVSVVEERLLSAGITPEGDPSGWFDLENASLTDGGFIQTIRICGTAVKGRTLRENILGTGSLKSCKILSISTDGENFLFETRGFGHGAGMSQQGALGYAAAGWSYRQILTHYYTGVTIG